MIPYVSSVHERDDDVFSETFSTYYYWADGDLFISPKNNSTF